MTGWNEWGDDSDDGSADPDWNASENRGGLPPFRFRQRPVARAFGSGTWAENRAARPQRAVHPLDDPALVSDFLDQDAAWCAAASANYLNSPLGPGGGFRWIAIADMEPSHALNTARFILNRARDICLVLAVGEKHSIAEPIDTAEFRARQNALVDDKARERLLDTPLVRALLARASEPPVSDKRPWDAVARDRRYERSPSMTEDDANRGLTPDGEFR